ncbi:MAG: hypothetical protein AAFY11_14990, partial [Cyanobacteria bacterium J06641_5]
MNHFFKSILGATIATLVAASSVLTAEVTPEKSVRSPYTPEALVTAAYNNRLDGISSFAVLESDVAEGNVEAVDLVRVAIAQGRLSPDRLGDRGFLNAVD